MASATLPLLAMYNYDPKLFDELVLPAGIDKNVLINSIMMRGGEFCVLYTNPTFIKGCIGVWSKKWYDTFARWVKALNTEYNPLENYDRIEEWTDDTTGSGNSNTLNKVSAYNSSTLQNNDKTESDNSYVNNGVHKGRTHGNIGVTTSQQMLESELDIARWNLYEHITDIFLAEFVLPVY